MNSPSLELEKLSEMRRYELYILTDCDIPFVQDGLRDGEMVREWMTRRFEERLVERQVPWIGVSGTQTQRLKSSVEKIDPLLRPQSM